MMILISIGVIVAILVILFLIWVKLYKTTTPDVAMVITGLGKTKVINNGGCMVIPGFQEITYVNLKTLKIDISKKDNEALFTQDVHANIDATFFVKVNSNIESIKKAAESLGGKLLNDITSLKTLLDGKFAGALRSIAANMTLKDLQEKRSEFVKLVQESLTPELEKNGLMLEEVSITHLNQTDPDKLPINDMFAARTRSITAREVQDRKKQENDAIRENEVLISKKDVETQKQKYSLIQDQETARLQMEQKKSEITATQKIIESQNIAKEQQESAEAFFKKDQAIAIAKAEQEKASEEADIKKNAAVSIAKAEQEQLSKEADISKDVAIANKSKEKSIAETEANKAIKEKVVSEQQIETAKLEAIANREKNIAVIKAQEEVEQEAVKIERLAGANFKEKEQEANGIKLMAEANEKHYEVEAEGKRKINEAENKLSIDIIQMKVKQATIKEAAEIIRAIVEPISHIDKFTVISAPNMFGNNSSNGSGKNSSNGSSISDIYEGALNYRAKNKVVDALLQEVGIDISNPNKLMEEASIPSFAVTPQPKEESHKINEETNNFEVEDFNDINFKNIINENNKKFNNKNN